jgi:predicted RNA binding protein YcfA (HicA-like mRNA interferase family)
MNRWPATKAKRILAALLRQGWNIKRTEGSHRILGKPGEEDYTFSFHDSQELDRAALSRIARETKLRPEDL